VREALAVSFSVEFLGCKISQTDVQGVRERLLAGGLEEAREGGTVHVVNTCCVTNEAVAKSRKAVRAALRRGAEHVYVTGCATRLGEQPFGVADARITVVRETAEEAAERIARELGATGCVGPAPRLERTRAFVKVQDGCTFGCAFCVIPRVRGASRSRPLRAVLAEARRRIAQGHRELVVTGVNLGLYRDAEARAKLPDVLYALAELAGIERVRLSSIEVNHLSRQLCEVLAHPRVCPHLHVPLQSGDDAVLRAMRRRYDLATYARRVERARAHVPGLNLTGDVIVGFPAEDDAAFSRTLAAVEALAFSRLHVFPYSPRPGTRTAGADPVSPEVKRRRAERLRALSDRLGRAHRAARTGQRDRVLVERVDAAGRLHGYGADYTAYELRPHAGVEAGDLVEVVLEAPGERAALGRVL
jgi:threonylcarbamoyladenosine tRNA methylthiotransferase MtaB